MFLAAGEGEGEGAGFRLWIWVWVWGWVERTMQINALPLSDKLAGEKLRDAETLGAQLARRRRWGAARRAALLLWHRSFPLAMF